MHDHDLLLNSAQKIADATGVSRWFVQAVKKFIRSRVENAQRIAKETGQPVERVDTPFTAGGKFTTRREFQKWMFRHPEFVAGHQFKKTPQCAARPPVSPS